MTHWIDAVNDLDIELLGMSDDALDAFAYDHAEPLRSASKATTRTSVVEHRHVEYPRAA